MRSIDPGHTIPLGIPKLTGRHLPALTFGRSIFLFLYLFGGLFSFWGHHFAITLDLLPRTWVLSPTRGL